MSIRGPRIPSYPNPIYQQDKMEMKKKKVPYPQNRPTMFYNPIHQSQ